ncbi:MAG: PaREP1 family protein [Nitrososphaerales archaeon]
MASKTEVGRYRRLNGRFLRDGEVLLKKGDYIQASERFWGAAAEIVKAVASMKGRKLRTHGNLFEYVRELNEAYPDLELVRDFLVASHLHSNFYEDELPGWAVEEAAEVVRAFVTKMEKFLK